MYAINSQDPKIVAQYIAKMLGQDMANILLFDMGIHYTRIKETIPLGDFPNITNKLVDKVVFPEFNIVGTIYDLSSQIYGESSDLCRKLTALQGILNEIRQEVDGYYEEKRVQLGSLVNTDLKSVLTSIVKNDPETARAIHDQSKKDDGSLDVHEIETMTRNYFLGKISSFKEHKEQFYTANEIFGILNNGAKNEFVYSL